MTREQAKREIDSLDYYLQNHTDDYSEESHTAMMMAISALFENKGEPEKGHWSRKRKVDAYDIAGVKTWGIKCQCDRCCFTTIVVEDFGYYRYCPNCGADMRGEE